MAGIAVVGIAALLVFALAAVIVGSSAMTAREDSDAFAAAWKRHRESCLQLPEAKYHYDRARAVRGFVHGPDGKAVSGALVQCIRLPSLLHLAQGGRLAPALWSGLVETETRTDSEGRYEFPHLREGCRTICVSASGLAPDVQSMIVVQDGSGARVDFNVEAPRTLRIRLEDADDRPRRIHLVPYRWWPELVSRDIAGGEAEVEFSGIGGPFRKGLVFVSDPSRPTQWELKAAFDLDRSDDVIIPCTANYIASPRDVPEAGCVLAWQPGMSEAGRLFYSMLTPVALFWQTDSSSRQPAFRDLFGQGAHPQRKEGGLRGYGPNAFLPVLIESRDGQAWLEWTSEAAEFELAGVPAGVYRIRSFDSFGRISFARGLVVPPSGVVDLASRLGSQIQIDEPLSREVMGIVRWENGRPAEEAVVYLQDATSFRRFLQRVVTNQHGYFRIPNVPAARYVAFALPAKDGHAMKSFVYPAVEQTPRETWLDFTLSPHRIVGQLPRSASAAKRVELVRKDESGDENIVWAVNPTETGGFEITNVPHGRYVVRTAGEGSAASIASVPFIIEREMEVVVDWAE